MCKVDRLVILALLWFVFSCGTVPVKELSIPTTDKVGAQVMPAIIEPIVNAPFDMPLIQPFVFPNMAIDIVQKGARMDLPITSIINKAIDEVSAKGGGTIIIPEGQWTSGRIELKNNVKLHLAKGAELVFSGNPTDYSPAVFTRHEGIEVMAPGAFIYANGQQNIAITGQGIIYGPEIDAEIRNYAIADTVIEKVVNFNTPVEERIYDGLNGRRIYVPKTISPINCKNVLIEGITLNRSLFWNICPIYCEDVIIRGVTVNSVDVPSGDGIDIESCKNVLIEYCTLNNGDDCFTIKAGRCEDGIRVGKPSENIIIRYSLAQAGDGGITCGSETAGGIKNLYAHDCVFNGTRRGIRFKTRRNRGGGVQNAYYERIRMIGVTDAFTWDLLGTEKYMGELARRCPPREIDSLTPVVKDIFVKDVIVESAQYFIRANGIPEIPLDNVLIDGGDINCNEIISTMDDVTNFRLKNLNINTKTVNGSKI